MRNKTKKVTATAKCASFDIEITAKVTGRGLVADDMDQISRKLKFKLADSISKLPFSHTYVTEVVTK